MEISDERLTDTIIIKIEEQGKILDKEVPAKIIGSLAIHEKYEDEEWLVISSVKQGLRMPGYTKGFKAAEACCDGLQSIGVDWDNFDGKSNDEKAAARQVLNDWGFDPPPPVFS